MFDLFIFEVKIRFQRDDNTVSKESKTTKFPFMI